MILQVDKELPHSQKRDLTAVITLARVGDQSDNEYMDRKQSLLILWIMGDRMETET